MFGEKIGFNLQGETKFKTCCGAFFTLAIFVFCSMYFVHIMNDVFMNKGNILHETQTPTDFFQGAEQPHNSETGFKFAVTVSSPRNFRGQNWDYIENYSRFTLNMVDVVSEEGNFIDATVTETAIEMIRCDGTEGFYAPNSEHKDRIEAHQAAE
jgi:hypothetical protein